MTVTSGPSTSRGAKRAHWLLKMIVRRNCYICFAITVICVAIATSTVITYSFWLSDKAVKYRLKRGKIYFINYNIFLIEIQNAKLRRERLSNRSKFDAYFQSSCQIFPTKLPEFDETYCNRYCEKNVHMEFMYRIIEDVNIKKKQNGKDCPHYVVLRSCQQRMFKDGTNITSYCEAKKFNKDFISIEDSGGNNTKTGICIPCRDDADESGGVVLN
ncbi:hypothetical protein Mgra_00005534 [Meloidogyne graminicola]|uniref:Uncharacterized protein n=1 Tax=Meloidogyne graminicola TaxID=189291 RepID=A0A8S9ZPF0_9BILA|nr:hypothetical protein Mgra_00005534 [Meloidogyne graminicola]